MATHRVLFALDHKHLERTLVAIRGDRLALTRNTVTFEDGEAGPAEVNYLSLLQTDLHGRVTHEIAFEVDDAAIAENELDARAATLPGKDEDFGRRT